MDNRRTRVLLTASLLLTAGLLVHPCKALLAEYYYGQAVLLNDVDMDYADSRNLTEESLSHYSDVERALRKAVLLVPGRADYVKALSGIYIRLGVWAMGVELAGQQLPSGYIDRDTAFRKATSVLGSAAALDPLEAAYHLSLAAIYRISGGDLDAAGQELERAARAVPLNSAVRSRIATQYLLQGHRAAALEHAKVLAGTDDSYIIGSKFKIEHRSPYFVQRASRSYLMRAFEIGWRASGKNVQAVKDMAPANLYAQETLMLFLERKGIVD